MNQTVAVSAQQPQVARAHLLARLQAGEGPVMVALNDPEPAGAVVLRETEVAGFASQVAVFLLVALLGQLSAAAIPLADHVSAPNRSPSGQDSSGSSGHNPCSADMPPAAKGRVPRIVSALTAGSMTPST